MKEGTKVKVTACFTGHEFDIGEVVMRKYLEEEHSEMCLGFVDDEGSSWYMSPEEYEGLIDSNKTPDLPGYYWVRMFNRNNSPTLIHLNDQFVVRVFGDRKCYSEHYDVAEWISNVPVPK